ncbi:(r)-limonene synthase [Phtheirospermum japonicum]|uniref:(R)-limonene synthase n=1 Tax=Phtheirospermum japonicum TaxID=374723 RepID=A0A830BHG5_9LAMI|nr:(r)-limonene synthase [Phtheirospermum japonicum]
MSTNMSMPVVIPNKPTCTTFIFGKKPSNFVTPINGIATCLIRSCSSFQLKAIQTCDDQIIINQRRSGNYKPPIWDFDFIQSLSSDYNKDARHLRRASELMFQVRMMLDEEIIIEAVNQLEFIDDLQRLGISYHFEDKIKHILNSIYDDEGCKYYDPTDLYSTSLRFRLLRQHGFSVSQGWGLGYADGPSLSANIADAKNADEQYSSAINLLTDPHNDDGDFKASHDTKGWLQLYEASFLLTQGETTLELAREFAAKFLQNKLDDDENIEEQYPLLLVRNALELPLHWRTQRPNSRWFINAYERRRPCNMNPIVLELAKLDFNIVQATHQQELKHVSKWWEQTWLAKKLPFARDRLVECYFWTIGGFLFEPRYGYARIMATKVNALVTTIDDMFDVYGTFEELQLFNDAIQR